MGGWGKAYLCPSVFRTEVFVLSLPIIMLTCLNTTITPFFVVLQNNALTYSGLTVNLTVWNEDGNRELDGGTLLNVSPKIQVSEGVEVINMATLLMFIKSFLKTSWMSAEETSGILITFRSTKCLKVLFSVHRQIDAVSWHDGKDFSILKWNDETIQAPTISTKTQTGIASTHHFMQRKCNLNITMATWRHLLPSVFIKSCGTLDTVKHTVKPS